MFLLDLKLDKVDYEACDFGIMDAYVQHNCSILSTILIWSTTIVLSST